MIRRPPRSTRVRSSAASDVYKRQVGAARRLRIPRLLQPVVQGPALVRLEMAESDPAQRRRVHDLSDSVAYAFEHASRTRVVEQRLLVADQELAELQIDLLDVGADAEDVRRDLADRGHLFAQSRGVRVR